MSETSISAAAYQRSQPSPSADDVLTICAISIVAGILTNILHEGVGHALVALLTRASLACSPRWRGRVPSIPVWSRRVEHWRISRLRWCSGRFPTYGVKETDDVRRWFGWLTTQQHPRCIFGMGESMGAAILLQAIKETRFCAVVAESPFGGFRQTAYVRVEAGCPSS